MRPLTVKELSLAEDLMSRKLSIPSAKEAKALLKGAASSSQRERKRKRVALPDTSVVDDLEVYKQSRAEAVSTLVGKSQGATSAEPSPVKSAKKAKGKSSEGGDSVAVPMPSDGSTYSDPSFVKDATEALLLPADQKRLAEIRPMQSAEWSLAHAYQVRMCMSFPMSCLLNFANLFDLCAHSDGVDPLEELDHRSREAECGLDGFQHLSLQVEREVGIPA